MSWALRGGMRLLREPRRDCRAPFLLQPRCVPRPWRRTPQKTMPPDCLLRSPGLLSIPGKTNAEKTGMGDDCDGCDGVFDTTSAPILIVTIVINRHAGWKRRLILLPFRVRLDVYCTWYSLANSPAFTFSCLVRILGWRSVCSN